MRGRPWSAPPPRSADGLPTVIGVISDTHGLLRPEAVAALRGAAFLIHAGDAGKQEVLHALERVAPVAVVRGNVDTEPWARALPPARTLEVESARIYVLHNLSELDFDPAARGYSAVISGHSHRARFETRDGVLYLNPGSAGPRRFKLPVTVAQLTVEGASLTPRIIELAPVI